MGERGVEGAGAALATGRGGGVREGSCCGVESEGDKADIEEGEICDRLRR